MNNRRKIFNVTRVREKYFTHKNTEVEQVRVINEENNPKQTNVK